VSDRNVKAEMADAASDFTDEDKDPYPFIITGKRGGISVSPPRLAQHFRDSNHYFLTQGHSGGATFWIYKGGIYARTSEVMVKGILMRYVAAFSPDHIKTSEINEAYSQLLSDDAYRDVPELDSDEDAVVFENGILDLRTMALRPHSPEHIGTIRLPLAWDPDAKSAPVFARFLSEMCGGDAEKELFLMEFIGVALSNIKGYRTKKALFLVGEGNTGKSQVRALVERLLGHENCASVDLATLERRFGTGLAFGKRLVGSNDLGFADIPELQVFKQLTGGDTMLMESKFVDGFTAAYGGVLWFSMNRLPSFGGDKGRHVFDRIVIVECGEPCPEERRDRHICDRMYAERDAIVMECLVAAAAVKKRGYRYSIPRSSTEALDRYETDVSTVKAFVMEFCVFVPNDDGVWVKSAAMYRGYRQWCGENGYLASSAKAFTREAAEFVGIPAGTLKTHRRDGDYYPFSWSVEGGFDELPF
jgi:P4 family phage/plasmid primase-like protien